MTKSDEKKYLLTAKQMAQFVVDGFLFFDDLIPEELNKVVLQEEKELKDSGYDFWYKSQAIRSVFELPEIKGILQSLMGNAIYDHSYLHVVEGRDMKGRGHEWHYDSTYDVRPYAFDIQVFYFAHDAPAEMGPTLVLPGSHLRRINSRTIARYKNIVGQRQLAGKAGTICFVHHGLWHCSQPNYTDQSRFMFKVRFRPDQKQSRLFNIEGYDSQEVKDIFLNGSQAWLGDERKHEIVRRAKLWRYLVDDDLVDVTPESALQRMSI